MREPEQGTTGEMRFDESGLVCVVAQDWTSGDVLMVAWADAEAVAKTRETGFAHFWSRSRKALWMKGETSGNRLAVVDLLTDCDDDTVLVRVRREGDGVVCHTGERSCFFRELETPESAVQV